MSTYNHPLSYFKAPIFFVAEDAETGAKTVGETTLESFLREWYEGDPARAWYVKEVTKDVPVWHNDEDGEREERYNEGSRERSDLPDEYKTVTTFEVRQGKHSNVLRDRLVETFDTEDDAERYHLNGLYWNYCNSNRDAGAPYSSHKREDVEEEIRTLAAMEEEDTTA